MSTKRIWAARPLAIVMLLVLGTAWYGQEPFRDSAKLLEWIESHHGSWEVDENVAGAPIIGLNLNRPARHGIVVPPDDELQDRDLAKLAAFEHLKRLSLLARSNLSDRALLYLSGVSSLERIDLQATRITGSGIAYLKKLEQLRELNLTHCSQIEEEFLVGLIDLPNLEVLALDAGSSRAMDGQSWQQSLALLAQYSDSATSRDLQAMRGGIGNVGLKAITKVASLQRLSLGRTKIDDAGAKGFRNLKKLQSLDISRTAITDDGLKNLTGLKDLKQLKLNFVLLTDEGCKQIAKLTQLEHLEIQGTPISDEGFKHLLGLQHLKTLDVSWTSLTDEAITSLVQLKSLDHLGLRGVRALTLRGLNQLASGHSNLTIESLLVSNRKLEKSPFDDSGEITSFLSYDPGAEDKDLMFLSNMSSLRRVSISGKEVTDETLRYLAGNKGLISLRLTNTGITDKGIRSHCADLTNLQTLRVSGSNVTFAGVYDLFVRKQGKDVGQLLNITGFDWLPGQQVSTKGRFVDLRDSSINDEGLNILCRAVSPQTLFLPGSEITSLGFKSITNNEKLERLWLGGSAISFEVLQGLGSDSLQELFLTDASITAQEIPGLARLFPNLRVLNLSGSLAGGVSAEELTGFKFLDTLIVDPGDLQEASREQLSTLHPELRVIESQMHVLDKFRNGLTQNEYRRLRPRPAISLQTKNEVGSFNELYGPEHFEQVTALYFGRDCNAESFDLIRSLTTLDKLSFHGDKDFSHATVAIAQLPAIREVSFYNSSLNDKAIEGLAGTNTLRSLDIQRTKVTNHGLKTVGMLKSLKTLKLGGYGTQIGDEGIAALEGLSELETLVVSRTRISDDAVKHVAKFKKLKSLTVRETQLSAEGLDELRAALPTCKIFF